MKTSEKVDQLFAALAVFQGNVKDPRKDADNPYFKSKYVTLDSLVACIRKPLSEQGLFYTQECGAGEGGAITVCTIVTHKSGQWIQFDPIPLNPTKKDPQGIGSAITYGRRYSLSAALGIAWCDEDDDGNACSQPAQASKQPAPQQPKQQPKQQAPQQPPLKYEDVRAMAVEKGCDMERFDKFVKDKYGDTSMLSQEDVTAIARMVNAK